LQKICKMYIAQAFAQGQTVILIKSEVSQNILLQTV
jgi:hypothetical protein